MGGFVVGRQAIHSTTILMAQLMVMVAFVVKGKHYITFHNYLDSTFIDYKKFIVMIAIIIRKKKCIP